MMKRHYYIIKGIVLLAAMLLAACSSSNSDDSPAATSQNEIHLTTNVTSMPSGTRTTTYDDAGLKTEGSFTCVAYQANTKTEYIASTTVDWTTNSRWEFNGGASHYYWPLPNSNGGAWPSLDFFAYVPSAENLATDAPYIITGPTYNVTPPPSVSHTVTFSCNMANTATKEFMFGVTLNQNGENPPAAGVPMQFIHPFARIRFKLSDASGTSVKINSITLGGTYYKTADYSYDGSTSESTWSNHANLEAFGPCQLNTDYLVIPSNPSNSSNYGPRTLTVNATWDEWSAVTRDISTTVDFNWESPGYSYTYVLTLKKYVLIVDTEKYTEQW